MAHHMAAGIVPKASGWAAPSNMVMIDADSISNPNMITPTAPKACRSCHRTRPRVMMVGE